MGLQHKESGENSLIAIEKYNNPFIAIQNYLIPSLPSK